MRSRIVVKLAGIYCCENSDSSVVLKGCMGRKEFPKSRKIHVDDRHIAQAMHIIVCRLHLGGKDLQGHCYT